VAQAFDNNSIVLGVALEHARALEQTNTELEEVRRQLSERRCQIRPLTDRLYRAERRHLARRELFWHALDALCERVGATSVADQAVLLRCIWTELRLAERDLVALCQPGQ